jgi:prepilin-type N-terminal cleavage/methylation domain-containing protein
MPRPPRSSHLPTGRPSRGASLPEVLIVLALVGMVSSAAWQALSDWRVARASREAARGMAADLRQVAQDARRQRRSLAIEFDLQEPAQWRVLADGNGNGVTSADVTSGVDAPQSGWRLVFREGRARLAVTRDLPSADGTSTVIAGSAPVQLGAMTRVVFTPRGTATAASVYVTGEGDRAYAIRVLGSTQRIRLLCLSRADTWETC